MTFTVVFPFVYIPLTTYLGSHVSRVHLGKYYCRCRDTDLNDRDVTNRFVGRIGNWPRPWMPLMARRSPNS